jgi:hypothetical protein
VHHVRDWYSGAAAFAAGLGLAKSPKEEVVAQLVEW